MEYLLVKWLHVLSSTVLFGTGLGSAFYMFSTNRSGDVRAIAIVTRRVVAADWLFTTPTAIAQPLTGFWLLHLSGVPWTAGWVLWSLVLYVIAGACWLPVVWIQIRMAALAGHAAAAGEALPARFWRYHALWTALGWPAFLAFVAIFFLMVVKPPI
jgi:uncharacterized membrane protein